MVKNKMKKTTTIITIILYITILTSITKATCDTTDLKANTLDYWTGDNLTDMTGNNDLVNVTNKVNYTTGIYGNAYWTGIGAFLNTTNNLGLDNADERTFSLWVYETQTNNWGHPFRYGGKAENADFGTYIEGASNDVYFTGYGAGDQTTTGHVVATQWTHILITYNGTGVGYYINGTNVLNWTHALTTTDGKLCLGGDKGGTDTRNDFKGYIDEIAVFNKTLNGDCIALMAQSPSTSNRYPYGVATVDNFSITAKDEYNSSTINTFSATLDGTTYSTTTGTITTNKLVNDTNTYDILIFNANNYNNRTYTAQTITSSLQAKLIPNTSISAYIQIYANDSIRGKSITNFTATINTTIIKTTSTGIIDTGILKNSTKVWTISITNAKNLTTGDYIPRTYTNTTFNNTNLTALLLQQTTHLINITIRKPDGTPAAMTFTWTINNTNKGINNPYQEDADNYLNPYTPEQGTDLNITVTDTEGVYETINTLITIKYSNLTSNISIESKQINLYLQYFNGTSAVIKTLCTATNTENEREAIMFNTSLVAFNTSEILIDDDDTESIIICYINILNTTKANVTNFYEFRNTGDTITENISIFENPDWYWYEQTAAGTEFIEGAAIRIYTSPIDTFSTYLTQWYPLQFTGQRLTRTNGMTEIFWTEAGRATRVRASAELYKTTETETLSSMENYDIENPLKIALKLDDIKYNISPQITAPIWFRDRTINIPITIYSPNSNSIQYMTTYRNTSSGATKDKTKKDTFTFTLTSGTDYSNTGTSNITLIIYENGLTNQLANTTIIYKQNYTNTIIPPESLTTQDQTIVKPLLLIGLLFLAFIVGLIIPGTEAGKWVFLIGGIVITAFAPTLYWMALANTSYFILKAIRKMIGE